MSNYFDNEKGVSDASLFLDIQNLSKEQFVEEITEYLKYILLKTFPNNKPKQQIFPNIDRITISCPYCGDSVHDPYKKRGNIILDGEFAGYYKCFNCGIFKDVNTFLKDFQVNPDLSVIDYVSKIKENISHNYNYDINTLLDIEKIESISFDREFFKSKFKLIEIKNSEIEKYLVGRLQFDFTKFLYNPNKKYLVVLNLTPNKKILGFQIRNFDKHKVKYKTFKLSKIYEILKIKKDINLEIDTLSQLYNITNIDYTKPITLFEGPLDSFLFKNSIANAGATKHFPLDLELRYWYDDDKVGREKAIEKINNNQSVFLWTKFREDFDIPYRTKWDLNDIILWFTKNKIQIPYFDTYFSNDPLDIIYI